MNIADALIDELTQRLSGLRFGPPVAFVYDPLEYARGPYEEYLRRYARPPKKAMLLGMNPGPWGMVQTGIPFGEVNAVRDWLEIDGEIGRPALEHPSRPVLGFACRRSEVSGRRLWGWAASTFGTAERFFADWFVANYCPLAFFSADGRNITPDRLRAADRSALYEVCDAALRLLVADLEPQIVIGVGRFAEERAGSALSGTRIRVGRIAHPSPANPTANRGWEELIAGQLSDLGLAPWSA